MLLYNICNYFGYAVKPQPVGLKIVYGDSVTGPALSSNLENDKAYQTFSMPQGLNGEVRGSSQKIYPNDPCPRGNGKKYKKCCGRK